MTFLPAVKIMKPHLRLLVSFGLLTLPLFTECDKIRLVGGPSRCAGRIEIFHRDEWGTVCDDFWSIINAAVACRELDCGLVIDAKRNAFFGEGKGSIWLDDVRCNGEESSISKCEHKPFGQNNCGHGEDAGVICSEHVRLANGTSRCNGRVEVHTDGRWRKACNSAWNNEEGQVLCTEVSCGSPVKLDPTINFPGSSALPGVHARCFGNETSMALCNFTESAAACNDIPISCANSKPVRLVNGSHRCSGRVEVFHDGSWGTVCDDGWGMQEAEVTCREMNCGTALSVRYKDFYGRGQDQMWLDDLDCTGRELSLAECPHRGYGVHDCSHSEDAGLECSELIRLINGTNRCSGRLMISHGGQWGKVCQNNWSKKESDLVCQELMCGNSKSRSPSYGDITGVPVYSARCPQGDTSISQCTFEVQPTDCESVSITCSGNPLLRLGNGTDRCSGRVEILHEGQWGTVCDDEWDLRDAQVVCREMDCGTAFAAKPGAFFGPGQGQIWLDDLNCVGNETSIGHCRRPSYGENNCDHSEDASVECSAYIKLTNGNDYCSGRVEFFHEDHWEPVYAVNWGMNEARVVCREMRCGDPVSISGSFGDSGGPRGCRITCNGAETSLRHCSVGEYARTSQDREATVVCSGNVRLTGGPNRCVGKAEVYTAGQWQTVCGNTWDSSDAQVVCNELKCGKPQKLTYGVEYGSHSEVGTIKRAECNGMELSFTHCTRPGGHFCNVSSVAGVMCSDGAAVRLSSDSNPCSGRVEVQHGSDWNPVCSTDWTPSMAATVCESLECGQNVNSPTAHLSRQGSGQIVIATNSCFANAASLTQCSARGFTQGTCQNGGEVSVTCAPKLRLASGRSECSGRVEIFYKGQWGTVCDDEWEMSSARVVCKQLGCQDALSAPGGAHFGRGSGPIWLDDVMCEGSEDVLSQCSHSGYGVNNCGHGEDASVICLGSLPKPLINLSPAAEVNFGEKVEITCTIITEHTGGSFILQNSQSSYRVEKYADDNIATFVITEVDFTHKGPYFCEYHKRFSSLNSLSLAGDPVTLTVKVALEKPSISLVSPHVMIIFSPDNVEVNKGNKFSITCSIHSKFAGGSFILKRSNTTIAEPKKAFGHSIFYMAYFEFQAIGYEHQGEYTCVYSLNMSSAFFYSPPSKSLLVTVIAPSGASAITASLIGIVVVLLVLAIAYVVWRKRKFGAGAMVRFSNRFAEALKNEPDDRSNGGVDGRGINAQTYEQTNTQTPDDKSAGAEPETAEDLTGRVCYELEPLIYT